MSPSLLSQGLTLMLAGMGTVFVFLTLLVIVMTLLSRLLGRFAVTAVTDATDGVPPDIVAAITAAIEQHGKRPLQ